MINIVKKLIKPKLGLIELAKQLGNVSQVCSAMGYSRDCTIVINTYMKLALKKRYKNLLAVSIRTQLHQRFAL